MREKYNQARAQALSSEEKNLENLSQVARLKDRQKKAEERALALTAELEEAKILLGKSKSDSEEQQKKISKFENVANDRDELDRKLKAQTELARRQEKQIAEQNDKIRELEEKLVAEARAAAKKIAGLENELDASKANGDAVGKQLISERGRSQAFEKQLASLKEDNAALGEKALELQNARRELERLRKESVNVGRLLEADIHSLAIE